MLAAASPPKAVAATRHSALPIGVPEDRGTANL